MSLVAMKNVFTKWLVLSTLVGVSIIASAKEIEGVSFPDQQDIGGQKLLLRGVGLRVKRKLGMNFKVYVAGLYLEEPKAQEAKAIIESRRPKAINLVFLRDVGASALREGWTEGYDKVCKDKCESTKANLKMFNDFMIDVKNKQSMKLLFEEDGVSVSFDGKEPHTGHITSPEFRQNMLAVFLGDNPPTPELKAGLLGTDVKKD